MKYGVALFPSKTLQDVANSYRMRYDSHYSFIPPHVTLREGFELDEKDLPTIVDQIRSIASEATPFSLEVYKADTFYPQSNVLFFKIREHEMLTFLYNRLHEPPFPKNHDYNFVPHVTIGQDLSQDELFDVLGQLKMKQFHHEELVDRIQLLYQLENGSWTVYETFLLGKEE
ncbi:YjcG family protein [Halalkalibacterium ligniniphilum]|uniref:YjcG family protein n=1 Tax=Halalkalibacterium ligniniphilum TaxID=1134413 RepID=UPI000347885A|nr:YjcG family protein [Halalkalibacterium ligniniphilum]